MNNTRLLLAFSMGLAGFSGAQDKETLHPYQFRVSHEVAEKMMLHRVEPDYPAEVKASGIAGQVVIRYVIDKQGNAIGVLTVNNAPNQSTNPQIREAAVKAVRQWKFTPYLLNGQPTEVETVAILTFNFGNQVQAPTPTPPAPSKPPLKIRVSSGVAEGILIYKVSPGYPEEAKKKRIKGDVILWILIDTKGNVADLKLIHGDPLLAEASIEAVRQWKYRPYLLNGEPVEVETTVKITFQL